MARTSARNAKRWLVPRYVPMPTLYWFCVLVLPMLSRSYWPRPPPIVTNGVTHRGYGHVIQDVGGPAVDVAATARGSFQIGLVIVVLGFHRPVVEKRPTQRDTRPGRGVVVTQFFRRIVISHHRVNVELTLHRTRAFVATPRHSPRRIERRRQSTITSRGCSLWCAPLFHRGYPLSALTRRTKAVLFFRES